MRKFLAVLTPSVMGVGWVLSVLSALAEVLFGWKINFLTSLFVFVTGLGALLLAIDLFVGVNRGWYAEKVSVSFISLIMSLLSISTFGYNIAWFLLPEVPGWLTAVLLVAQPLYVVMALVGGFLLMDLRSINSLFGRIIEY